MFITNKTLPVTLFAQLIIEPDDGLTARAISAWQGSEI
jgi:hypothetical protein